MSTASTATRRLDVGALQHDLAAAVDGEVRFDAGTRSAYSTDASNYRWVPVGVVVPRSVDGAVEAVAVCRRHGAAVLSRGGGTSLGGQCANAAVVIDWSKYCDRLVAVDADARTCLVEPGIVLDSLNAQLRDYDLEFGPEPATHSHCTLGGMIGNNSCGATAQRTGKVVDNVVRLEVLLYDGTRLWVGATSDDDYARLVNGGGRVADLYRRLRALRDAYADDIRARYPDIPRRVSGYNLDSLLPENGFDVARALVGSEGTLVVILRAELRLVRRVAARSLVVLGYRDVALAGDAVPEVLPSEPIALEGFDDRLVAAQRRRAVNQGALRRLPQGGAWLLAQMGGETRDEADDRAAALLERLGRHDDDAGVARFDDPAEEAALWAVREAALGVTAHVPGQPAAWPGWEDAAVRPDNLGAYLRELAALYEAFHYAGVATYGHFGQACIHARVPFDLLSGPGVADFRRFVERAADLVVAYGGSLSGEHGDGQARGELLAKMFGARLVGAFGEFKAIFDPDNRMNPGKVVDPRPLDVDLRLGPDYDHGTTTFFRYADDEGSFGRAVLRCVGVGKCRRADGGVMCPSYMATREEEHSTRGRARLLFEMLDGTARGGTIADGWRSKDVLRALDLCLACKGCKSDCPVNVDMATYKAEFLAHHYAGRVRPRSHYSMGWLPLVARLASHAPRAANFATHARGLAGPAKFVAGVDHRRALPVFAATSFQRAARRPDSAVAPTRGEVVLWPDTFTNFFDPHIADAAAAVLEGAGWRVRVPTGPVCCGLTWISTGQLRTAKRVLHHAVRVLRDHLRAGGMVVGLEPSCTAVFRADAAELLPDDEDVGRLRRQTVTLAELLNDHTPGWQPPALTRRVVVQTHCHQHAVLGRDADLAVLADAGADVELLEASCCGLAGNFGFERGHYDVSMACAERVLLPAVRRADADTVLLADGFSCRTQIRQATGDRARHLAELLTGEGGAVTRVRPSPAPPKP